MTPVAQALDLLQTEKDMYAGAYTVTILKLLKKLEKLTKLKYCCGLVQCLIRSVAARYAVRNMFSL